MMTQHNDKDSQKTEEQWLESRIPLQKAFDHILGEKFFLPNNLNALWSTGFVMGAFVVILIITGVFASIHYNPELSMAYSSVKELTNQVHYGWLVRYLHMNAASFMFMALYFHLFRGLYYGSYKAPREFVWLSGIIMWFILMFICVSGYSLPWTQMSYWGLTITVSMVKSVPVVGDFIAELLLGGGEINHGTLHRMHVLHTFLPFVIVGITILHVWSLHTVSSNNPTGKPLLKKQMVPFQPYYTVQDALIFAILLLPYIYIVYYHPEIFNPDDALMPANALQTPEHITPPWYLKPAFVILNAVPSKALGVNLSMLFVGILVFCPWLDSHKERSMSERPIARIFCILLILDYALLIYLGFKKLDGIYMTLARVATVYYFAYFIIFLPFSEHLDNKETGGDHA